MPRTSLNSIVVPGERAFPESIPAASDGTLYVSSLASGGIARITPGASTAEHLDQACSSTNVPIFCGSARTTCRFIREALFFEAPTNRDGALLKQG